MTHHVAYVLSLTGTVIIWLGAIWIFVGAMGYLSLLLRRRYSGATGGGKGAQDLLESLLGKADLPGSSVSRAVRIVAQYSSFRAWIRWGFRVPLYVLILGEVLHLGSNIADIHLHEHVQGWRVVSNSIGLVGCVLLSVVIGRLLLAGSPRLEMVRRVLDLARALGFVNEDQRGDHVDRVLRRFGRLEGAVAIHFSLAHAAGDPYTRKRLVAVGDGLYGLLVDAKQDLLFANSLRLEAMRQTLWLVVAAAAADPGVLSEAEAAASSAHHRINRAMRPRAAYRVATVLTVLAVIAAVVGLWYVDHSALSVIFSAVAAPLLVPAVVGFARRGWTSHHGSEPSSKHGKAAGSPEPESEERSLIDLATEISAAAREVAA